MAYKVRITDSAKAELDEIVAYFVNTLCNPKAAVSLLEDFNEQKSYLYDDPYTFSLCPILSLQKKRISQIYLQTKLYYFISY